MSNNPYSGRVPLHLQKGGENLQKAVGGVLDHTSYRPGITHKPEYRNQYVGNVGDRRNVGTTILRRYPNGRLDHKYVAHTIIDIIHKMKDGGFITDYEKACLSTILPDRFSALIDPKIAQTMTNLAMEERMLIGLLVDKHMREELNWNAGRGGGSVPGRGTTRS